MRISENLTLPSIQARDGLRKSGLSLQESLRRIGSGRKINKAADDAAGLTIASKLEGQIRGLRRSILNAQDGISALQTADGAMAEGQSILNRMRELAIQSGDDALTNDDRFEIQKEVDQLVDEMDRIANTTEFNQKKLLDGSAGIKATTSNQDVAVFQAGGTQAFSEGSGDASLRLLERGASQLSYSAHIRRADTGETASLKDTLDSLVTAGSEEDLAADLKNGTDLILSSRRSRVHIQLDEKMTLEDLTQSLDDALRHGMDMSLAEVEFLDGRFRIDTHMTGSEGQVEFLSSESVRNLFQFSNKRESTQAVYGLAGDAPGARSIGDGVAQLESGNSVDFLNPTSAYVKANKDPRQLVRVIEDSVFSLADTNAHGTINPGAATGISDYSEVARISIQEGAYTLDQLVTEINNQVSSSVSAPARAPGVVASHDGQSLILTTTHTGTSAFVSIQADANSQTYLGISDATVSGTGGGFATLDGVRDITPGMVTSGNGSNRRVNLIFSDADGQFNNVNVQTPVLPSGVFLNTTNILNLYNNALTAQAGGLVQARADGSGDLEFFATGAMGTGDDGGFYLQPTSGDLMPGIPTGVATTVGGAPAVYTGAVPEADLEIGYEVSGEIQFEVVDGQGRSSGAIIIGGKGVSGPAEPFQLPQSDFISILDGSNLSNTSVRYRFDDRGRLEFYSLDTGKKSLVAMRTLNPESARRAKSSFGIGFNEQVRGTGERDFRFHMTDNRLGFQVGANQNQRLEFGFGDLSAQGLGLEGLAVDSYAQATESLGRIDRAQGLISSQRAQAGALINRLNSSVRGLEQTAIDSQAGTSRIEDADIAKTAVDVSRAQVLQSSGTTVLAQAQSISREMMLSLLQ